MIAPEQPKPSARLAQEREARREAFVKRELLKRPGRKTGGAVQWR